MKYRWLGLLLLGAIGFWAAIAFAAGESTGTVTAVATACADASVPAHAIGDNGATVYTIPAASDHQCRTQTAVQTYTIPTVTETVTGTTTPPPPPPPPGPSYGGRGALGVLRYAGGLSTATNLGQYRLIITDHNTSEDQLAASQPGISLEYTNMVSVCTGQDTGVSYTQAHANGWTLKTSAGAEISISTGGSGSCYLVDPGNSGYQQAWAQNVSNYIASIPGLDGTFIDNLSIDYKEFTNRTGDPALYSTRLSWEAAVVSFSAFITGYLHAHGVDYIAANAGAYSPGDARSNDGTLDQYWWNKLEAGGAAFDGLMHEHWLFPNGHARYIGSGTGCCLWDNSWDSWEKVPAYAQAVGADFIGLDVGSSAQVIRFGRASMMLEWDCGDGVYIFNSSGDPWSYGANQDLGCATGAKRQVATNIWRRDFARGYVVVNPTTAAWGTIAAGDAQIVVTP